MVKELDDFIQFLIEHRQDSRVRISKKMKYGFRHYYLTFVIDGEPEDNNQRNFMRFTGSVEICFDNRNQCIDIIDNLEDNHLVLEDKDLLEKWNPILEEIVNSNMGDRVQNLMEKSLSACYNKDLYRVYKMRNLLDNDEERDF